MTIMWAFVGGIVGNLCWWVFFYWFLIQRRNNPYTATNKAAVAAVTFVLFLAGVWCLVSPETAF
jgi:hypothetical protein